MFRKAFTIYLKATFLLFAAFPVWFVGYILFTGYPPELVALWPEISEYYKPAGLVLQFVGAVLGWFATLNYAAVIREQEEGD